MFRKELEFEKRDYLRTGERPKESSSQFRQCFISSNGGSDSTSIVTREKKISPNIELKSRHFDDDTNCSEQAHVEAGDWAELKINTFPHAHSIQKLKEDNCLKGMNNLSPRRVEEEATVPNNGIEPSPLMPTSLMDSKLDLSVLNRKGKQVPLNVVAETPLAQRSVKEALTTGDRSPTLGGIVRNPKSHSPEPRQVRDTNKESQAPSKFKTMMQVQVNNSDPHSKGMESA